VAHILLLEPDRVVSKCISDIFVEKNHTISIVGNADRAIEACDKNKPDVVVLELSIPGHSGSEFLYEFRTYTDWLQVPVVIYSSLKPPVKITESKDWKLLGIYEFLYKPDVTLNKLMQSVDAALER
jgi:DNA-binding response OmpR family regulator